MVQLTREKYNIVAKRRGIANPQNMSTKKLLNTLNRYDNRRKDGKLSEIGLEKIAKIPNILENEVNQAKKLQRKSIDKLKEIARLRRIKNRDKLTKEDLIITLLKSASSDAERNYMKHFNNNTDDDDDDDDDDDTPDGKIKGQISDIRMILSRLGNTVTKNDGKKIKGKLYKIERKKNLSNREKKREICSSC